MCCDETKVSSAPFVVGNVSHEAVSLGGFEAHELKAEVSFLEDRKHDAHGIVFVVTWSDGDVENIRASQSRAGQPYASTEKLTHRARVALQKDGKFLTVSNVEVRPEFSFSVDGLAWGNEEALKDHLLRAAVVSRKGE